MSKSFTVQTDAAEEKVIQEMQAAAGKGRKDRKTYTEEEKQAALEAMETVGKKGVHLSRINLAFKPSVYEYIKTMSKFRGQTMTQFVNHVIELNMEQNAETYQKVLEFREMF